MLLALGVAPVQAAEHNVATYAELVAAINTSNTSSEADSINITGAIALTDDLPPITSAITINGNNNTIDGQTHYQAFNLTVGGHTLVINDLTMTQMATPTEAGGNGGGLDISPSTGGRATVTLNRVTIRDSKSAFSGQSKNGGGLFCTWANVTIRDSAVFNNRGGKGGGVFLGGQCTMTITRSAIYDNSAVLNGGGITADSSTAELTINNSSIYGNTSGSGSHGGGIFIGAGALVRLNHVTITGNTAQGNASNFGGGIGSNNAGNRLHVRNSIVFGNTLGDCYFTAALLTNTGNIFGTGNCSTPTGVFGSGGDPQLPAKPPASEPWYALSPGSPAIDGAACLDPTAVRQVDQRGRGRPSGPRCDIGAYEYQYPVVSGGSGGSGGSGSSEGGTGKIMTPAETCADLMKMSPAVEVSNAGGGTACQEVEPAGYGHPDLTAEKPASVVDVWGEVTPNTQVCFQGTSGKIRYVDTSKMKRTVTTLSSFSKGTMICATIDGPGQVALIQDGSAPGGQAPAAQEAEAPEPAQQQAQQQAPASNGLNGCMVKTQGTLNFRKSPAGERQEFTDPWGNANSGWLPGGVTLTALERSGNWLKVDYYGTRGWISAAYVTTSGSCG